MYNVIILAAGMGSRLKPYTNDKPKCLVEIFDRTIFSNLMNNLLRHKNKINKVLIGVGFEKEKMIAEANKYKDGLCIEFCHNDDYAKTNNIISMKMALDVLKDEKNPILLFESDLYVTEKLIDEIFSSEKQSFAVVSAFEHGMDGSCLVVKNKKIIQIKHHSELHHNDKGYKTVNIYKFDNAFIKNKFSPILDAYCKMSENSYYELILAVLISTGMCKEDFDYLEVDYSQWHEIDTINDLMIAEYKFSSEKEKYKICEKSFGGYWNYDIKDFNLVCNSHNTNEDFIRDITPVIDKLITSYPSNYNIIRKKAASFLNIDNENHLSVGNGSCEIINILREKYRFGTVAPCFGEYKSHVVETIPSADLLSSEEKITQTSFNLFSELAKKDSVDCVCIVNPNNPTSTIIPKEKIIEMIRNNKSKMFILDESFIDFTDGKDSLMNDYKEYENLAIVKSLGKQYNIAGIRLGVLVSKNEELISYIKEKLSIWNISAIAEFYLENAVKYEKKFKASLTELEKDKKYFLEKLEENGFVVIASKANYIFCKTKLKAQTLKEKLIKHGIIIKHILEDGDYSFYRFNVRPRNDIDLFISSL